MEMPDRVCGTRARVRRDGVDPRSLERSPEHDDRRSGARELGRMGFRHAQRDEDQAVHEALLEIAHDRQLVRDLGACRVQHQPPVTRPHHFLDRRHHRRVDRVRDVGHRECDLAGPARTERPRRGIRDVADLLGRVDHAREDVGRRPDAVQHP